MVINLSLHCLTQGFIFPMTLRSVTFTSRKVEVGDVVSLGDHSSSPVSESVWKMTAFSPWSRRVAQFCPAITVNYELFVYHEQTELRI